MDNGLFDSLELDLGDLDYHGGGLDFADEGKAPEKQNRFIRAKKFRAVRCYKYDNARRMAAEIGRLEDGEHIDSIVSGDFIAGDFLEAYLDANGLKIEEALITTLSLAAENVDSLQNILNFYAAPGARLGLVVSDYFYANEKRRNGGIPDIAEKLGGRDDFVLAVAGIHTKISLLKTTCGMHLAIGGSANLRSSMNIEQFTIDNSKEIYNFHREWIASILNSYYLTGNMLRRGKLWQAVVKGEEQKKPRPDTERQG
jgi:hypothetical protein